MKEQFDFEQYKAQAVEDLLSGRKEIGGPVIVLAKSVRQLSNVLAKSVRQLSPFASLATNWRSLFASLVRSPA